jgi:uncharacterized protein (TIGR03118 family)
MLRFLANRLGDFGRSRPERGRRSARPALEKLEDRTAPAVGFFQTNLVSDLSGVAAITDTNLKNPWGMAVLPNGSFWVSNAASGTVTLYSGDVNGSAPQVNFPVITLPHASGTSIAQPTGQVFNPTSSFMVNGVPATTIVDGLDGTITAIAPNPFTGALQATLEVSTPGAVYTGLALAPNSSGNFLFAADPAQGRIDVFNSSFQQVALSGNFTDPNLPAGLVPFNVVPINGVLFVTYNLKTNRFAGNVVDTFDTNGNFIGRFASGSNLVAPWAVVMAPGNFGVFSNDLLIGNFGDGRINVYNPSNGAFLGQLTGINSQPIAVERLWQLSFGNGTTAGSADILYFTGGLNQERDGLFGALQPATSNQLFINQAYNDLLHRPADQFGLAYWNALMSAGAGRQQIVLGIESSLEFRTNEVTTLYEQFLHRLPDPAGLNFWVQDLALGARVEQVAAGITGSLEFFLDSGGTTAGFLNSIYADALGRLPTGQTPFAAALAQGVTTEQVSAVIFSSTEFRQDDVRGFYLSYLRRQADSFGLSFFVNAMAQGAADEQVIAAIVGSNEYFARL